MSPRVNDYAITQVLAGTSPYDSLGEQEQAIVREEWADCMTFLRVELDYAAQFAAAGDSYSEIDEDGNLFVHPARDRCRCCTCSLDPTVPGSPATSVLS